MNISSDNAQSPAPVSLDSLFTPPSRAQWVELAVAGLSSGTGEQALLQQQRQSLEGIAFEVLYDAAHDEFTLPPAGTDEEEASRQWDNRVCVDATDAEHANASAMQALQGGSTSIELHTQSPDMLLGALQGVQLNIATLSLRSGKDYKSCADALETLAAAQGIDANALRCGFNADPMGSQLALGAHEQPMKRQLDDMVVFAKATLNKFPLANSVLVDTAVHHNAGASTVEELHAAIATATLYLEAMLDAGINAADASHQIGFQVAMDTDVLLGVAKLRALRILWRHTVQKMDGQVDVKALNTATIVAETSRRFTSRLEPWNNHLRNLSASTAAFIGSANALIVHPHDLLQRSNVSHDTSLGDRMARNIAIILERECGLAKVHDPMAGSYAIENLTQQIMQHTWQSLASTDTSEGWLDEVHSGRWQSRLSQTHRQRVALLEHEQHVLVGVNRFVPGGEMPVALPENEPTPASALVPVREAEDFEKRAVQEVIA